MLRDLQYQFFEAIFAHDEKVLDQIHSDERLSAGERLAIYRGSVYGILCRALGEIYPVCQRLVGEEFFNAMCRRFIPRHRPTGHNLQQYGEELPAFLDDFAPVRSLPYLPDVARLEWAWHRAFHAADDTGFDTEAFAALTAEQQAGIVLRLPISATQLEPGYPVDRIWQVNQPDRSEDQAVDLDEGGVRLLVWRRGHQLRIDRLSAAERSLLGDIAAGLVLSQLASLERHPRFDDLLVSAVGQGWIAGYDMPTQR